MTEFLHELIKKQEWHAHVQELLESDPWQYSEPPPPFTGNINMQEQRDTGQGPY